MLGLCILLDTSTRTHHPFRYMFRHFYTGLAGIYFSLLVTKTQNIISKKKLLMIKSYLRTLFKIRYHYTKILIFITLKGLFCIKIILIIIIIIIITINTTFNVRNKVWQWNSI